MGLVGVTDHVNNKVDADACFSNTTGDAGVALSDPDAASIAPVSRQSPTTIPTANSRLMRRAGMRTSPIPSNVLDSVGRSSSVHDGNALQPLNQADFGAHGACHHGFDPLLYHLLSNSTLVGALGRGSGLSWIPSTDIDGQARPQNTDYEPGADEQ